MGRTEVGCGLVTLVTTLGFLLVLMGLLSLSAAGLVWVILLSIGAA